ncbi:MAG: SRPBCC family protein, partial [Acidimicrobiales bacterium]
TYKNTGALAGITLPDGYRDCGFDPRSLSLMESPRCDSYRGFIFGCLDPGVDELEGHLGPVTEYVDRFLDVSSDVTVRVLRGVRHRYRFHANWKLQMENTVDGYHPGFTHRSFFDLMAEQTGKRANPYFKRGESPIRSKALGHGHAVLDFGAGRSAEEFGDTFYERVREAPGAADILASFEAEMGTDVARKELNGLIATGLNLAVFPNLGLIQSQIRVIRPISVDETEVVLYPTELVGVDPRVNYLRRRGQEVFFGPAGLGGPDDVEMFRRCQDGFAAGAVGWTVLARGHDASAPEPDGSEGDFSAENAQRGQYREWARLMSGGATSVAR